jgi:hypothetical protein
MLDGVLRRRNESLSLSLTLKSRIIICRQHIEVIKF